MIWYLRTPVNICWMNKLEQRREIQELKTELVSHLAHASYNSRKGCVNFWAIVKGVRWSGHAMCCTGSCSSLRSENKTFFISWHACKKAPLESPSHSCPHALLSYCSLCVWTCVSAGAVSSSCHLLLDHPSWLQCHTCSTRLQGSDNKDPVLAMLTMSVPSLCVALKWEAFGDYFGGEHHSCNIIIYLFLFWGMLKALTLRFIPSVICWECRQSQYNFGIWVQICRANNSNYMKI